MKKVAIINSSSPLNTANGREALDMAMIYAAFDQDVSYILKDEAVLSLKLGQHPEAIGHKDYFSTIKALELYDVENLIACKASLAKFNLTADAILPNAKIYSTQAIQQLIAQQDHVVTF